MRYALHISMIAFSFFTTVICAVVAQSILMDIGGYALKTGDGNTAVRYMTPVAFFGYHPAQCILGDLYAFGLCEIAKNDAKAIYWYERCGTSGKMVLGDNENPAASYELEAAKQYARGGWGVKVDPVECAKWLKLAAEGGNKEAQSQLAQSLCH
ncbi:tetratricopeptide repeat protein [Fundidesulfovibrio agrisoli]|uniref:tetratricopeptide repeat protein n=1 Tax=Fundidesulfovibrio agrisoli TaxID=2922717 RepID=UPI001FACA5F0|nr:hypothetical protein [Fundidesulfovibrio agrisoli]